MLVAGQLAAGSFAREDEWMQATRFSCRRDHTLQHRVVLEVMREGLVQAREGQLPQVRQMASQFRDWYHKHVQTMDAALALHLRGQRFDPANGGPGTARSASQPPLVRPQ
jgi:hemerythrin